MSDLISEIQSLSGQGHTCQQATTLVVGNFLHCYTIRHKWHTLLRMALLRSFAPHLPMLPIHALSQQG